MNLNNESLVQIENNNRPATIDDFKEIACYTDNMVGNITSTINNVAARATEIHAITANVRLQCAQLDHALDCLMLKAQRDLKIYEQSLPILDKQFAFCQSRLDKLMDKAMDFISDDFSDESLARQEAMMTLIEVANTSLNTLIAKLIPNS